MKEVEDLTIQIQSIKYEQIELCGFMTNYYYKDLNKRMNSLEMRENEHKQVMSDLQKWPMEISDASKKCKGLRKQNKTYSYLHSQIGRELPELKNRIHVLRAKKRTLWEEQIALQESCEEGKRLLKELREICDPCAEKHQEQESLDEKLKNLLKQEKLSTQKRDFAEKLQHHISVPKMRSENLECEVVTAQDESLLQTELPQQV